MKKYFLNLTWMLGDRVLMLVYQLFIFAAIKRIYGLDTLGAWSTINNLSQLLMSIFMLGIDLIVIKKIIENKDSAGKEIGSAIVVQIIGAMIYATIFYLIIIFYYSNLERVMLYFWVFVVANFFSIFAKSIFWHYNALLESKYRATTIITSILISFGIMIVITKYNPELIFYSYAIYYVIQFSFSLLIYFIFFKQRSKWKFSSSSSLAYLKVGSKLMISTLSVAIFVQADTLMLEKLSGIKEVGIFSAALRVSSIWFFAAGVIASAFFPKIVAIKDKQDDSLFLLRWMTGCVLILSIFSAIFINLFGGKILELLYGGDMTESSRVLSIHIWSGVFIFMGAFSSKWLYAHNEINLEIYKTLIAAVFNVIANFIVIPSYGAVGASFVSLVSYFLANILFFAFVKRTRPVLFSQLSSFRYLLSLKKFIKDCRRARCLFQS